MEGASWRLREYPGGGSEMADEADHDGDMIDVFFGNLNIGIVGIDGAAQDGAFAIENLFEDDPLGGVKDMGASPLHKGGLLYECAGELIAGLELGHHGVASCNDRKVVMRESRDNRYLFTVVVRNRTDGCRERTGSGIEWNAWPGSYLRMLFRIIFM